MQALITNHLQLNVSNPYLFLRQELEITKLHPNDYTSLKNNGWIRHCKILNNGRIYDYIVKQEYNTIEEWLASWAPTNHLEDVYHGGKPTMKDVRFGIHRNMSTGMYSTDYVVPFKDAKVEPTMNDQMKQLVAHLESKKMDMSSVMINFNSMIMPFNHFMQI